MGINGRTPATLAFATTPTLICLSPAEASVVAQATYGSAVWGGDAQGECASPEGSFNFLNNSTCFFAPSSGSLDKPATGTATAATASLLTGSVTASASGVFSAAGGQFGGAGSHALIWDTITFSGAAPGAIGTFTTSGVAYFSGDARVDATAVILDYSYIRTPLDEAYVLLEGNYNTSITTQGAYSISQTFGIANGRPMFVAIGVDAAAGVGALGVNPSPPGSASITDPISFDLPAGVTYTLDSAAAPEPDAWALIMVGVGMSGLIARRRRSSEALT